MAESPPLAPLYQEDPPPSRWLSSAASEMICLVLSALDAIGVLIGFGLIAANLIMDKPLAGVTWLLIPAVPLLVVGQLWCVAIGRQRGKYAGPPGNGRWGRLMSTQPYAALGPFWAVVLIVGFVLGWVVLMTGILASTNGNPTAGTPDCPWRLINHGVYTCVSHDQYVSIGASLQRAAIGVFTAFFVAHFGYSFGELRRRRNLRRLSA